MSTSSAATISGFLHEALFDPDKTPEPEEPIVRGLVYKGDLVVWIGREKHRKSNLALQAAICIALGRPFLNFTHGTGKPMRVVYVDYESKNASFAKRYNGICTALGVIEADKDTLAEHLKIILVRELHKRGRRMLRFPVKLESKEDKAAGTLWQQIALDYPGDVYIFDPMRCLHAQDENDSNIERLLSRLREVFRNAAIIVPHHMTKASASTKESYTDSGVSLSTPGSLRAFANGGRGSSAIIAHADCILCQERRLESDVETLYLGAYMKDSADVEPIALVESEHESFLWIPSASVPEHLRQSFEALKGAKRNFKNEADAASVLIGSNMARSTAYRHLKQLRDNGVLVCGADGSLAIKISVEPKS